MLTITPAQTRCDVRKWYNLLVDIRHYIVIKAAILIPISNLDDAEEIHDHKIRHIC